MRTSAASHPPGFLWVGFPITLTAEPKACGQLGGMSRYLLEKCDCFTGAGLSFSTAGRKGLAMPRILRGPMVWSGQLGSSWAVCWEISRREISSQRSLVSATAALQHVRTTLIPMRLLRSNRQSACGSKLKQLQLAHICQELARSGSLSGTQTGAMCGLDQVPGIALYYK